MTLLEQLPASASVYDAIRKLGGSERTVGYYYTACAGAATAHDADHKMATTRYCKEIRNNIGGCRAWDQAFDPPHVEGADARLASAVSK